MEKHTAVWYFVHNKIAICTFFGWLTAQTIKVLLGVIREKRFNFKWLVGTGGMPSSHVAGVTALATSIGLQEGVHTGIFVVTLMFSIVVICDAQGVRYSTGKQAEILNKIMDDIYWSRDMHKAWKEIISWPEVRVSVDLFHMGILLLRRDLHKREIKIKF